MEEDTTVEVSGPGLREVTASPRRFEHTNEDMDHDDMKTPGKSRTTNLYLAEIPYIYKHASVTSYIIQASMGNYKHAHTHAHHLLNMYAKIAFSQASSYLFTGQTRSSDTQLSMQTHTHITHASTHSHTHSLSHRSEAI